MSINKPADKATVNIINGETVIHIPQHIIEQLGHVKDGAKLDVAVQAGQILILKP